MEIKQNQLFFHETYSNLTSFFIDHKMVNYFKDFFIISIFPFHPKSEHKQVKGRKNKQNMYTSDSIFSLFTK